MSALKYLLMSGGFGMILAAVGILGYDLYAQTLCRKALAMPGARLLPEPTARWRISLALAFLAWGPILLAFGIVIVPTGRAGVQVANHDSATAGAFFMNDVLRNVTTANAEPAGPAEQGEKQR